MTKMKRAVGPLAWMTLGWLLAALYILGLRTALNRGLDAGYSVTAWLSSLG